jgi:hypothetical protein
MKKGELKKIILEVLSNTPKARDDDQYLTLCIWNRYFKSKMLTIPGDPLKKTYVALTDILVLPREDNVKRIRAVIQNDEGKFLPTTLAFLIQSSFRICLT